MPNYVAGDLRDQLAHAGYSMVSAGLVVGSGGNLSARVPDADTCWVTGAGTWLDRLNRSDFAEVGLADGGPAGGRVPRDGVPPSTELALHLATYRVRPDVRAIVHLHPQTALLLDALGERIRLVSTDHAVYLRRIVTTPFRPPGSAELAGVAAAAAADGAPCSANRSRSPTNGPCTSKKPPGSPMPRWPPGCWTSCPNARTGQSSRAEATGAGGVPAAACRRVSRRVRYTSMMIGISESSTITTIAGRMYRSIFSGGISLMIWSAR